MYLFTIKKLKNTNKALQIILFQGVLILIQIVELMKSLQYTVNMWHKPEKGKISLLTKSSLKQGNIYKSYDSKF